MGRIQILNSTGHTDVVWDQRERGSVLRAEREFLRLAKGGYVPFRRDEADDGAARRMIAFDPGADRILFIRPVRGG